MIIQFHHLKSKRIQTYAYARYFILVKCQLVSKIAFKRCDLFCWLMKSLLHDWNFCSNSHLRGCQMFFCEMDAAKTIHHQNDEDINPCRPPQPTFVACPRLGLKRDTPLCKLKYKTIELFNRRKCFLHLFGHVNLGLFLPFK